MAYYGSSEWAKDRIIELQRKIGHLQRRIEDTEQRVADLDEEITCLHDSLLSVRGGLRDHERRDHVVQT